MNIVMLGHKRVPSREGGIEIVVEELSTRLVTKGYSVTCFNRKGHHVSGSEFDGEKRNTYKGVKLIDVMTISRKGLAAMTSSVFGAIKAAFGLYDIIHFHAEGPAFMCWLPKLKGKRIVVTIHGLDWKRIKWGKIASWYIHSGEKNAVKYADEIIVLSEDVKRYFKEEYGRETNFIPNGVNRPVTRDAKRITDKWGIRKDEYILFVGRLVPEKGIHYLIEAFKTIETEKKLVIAGGSSDTDNYLNELTGISGKEVIFTGFIQGIELDELYSNAYLYCLPSDLEGMPLSLLEAMSYGNCCLVSDINECTAVVGDKAAVFKKGNIADLREKLQLLCDDKKLVENYKSIAQNFILNKYSWDDVVNNTIELYRGLNYESIND